MMKDITHYFADPVKLNENAAASRGKKTEGETAPENPKGKRTRVKIKISKTTTEERVCDIIESKNDMVDKTPSPFTKIDSLNASPNNGTPKSSVIPKTSSRKSRKVKTEEETKSDKGLVKRSQRHKKSVLKDTEAGSCDDEPRDTRLRSVQEEKKMQAQEEEGKTQILAEVDLNHESNGNLEKHKKGRRQNNAKDSFNDKNSTSENSSTCLKVNASSNKKNVRDSLQEKDENCISQEDTNNNSDINNIVTIDLSYDSDDENNSQTEQSNAFQILMSNTKVTPSSSPTKSSQDTELSVKKTEESREKLRRTKEKLVALADKKGYSKRKLAEVEEGEKIEKNIETRIKAFKLDEKKDNNATAINQGNQRQSSGSLLNYFSKIPPELAVKEMNTFVVKADVHMPENCDTHSSKKSVVKRMEITSRSKKSNIELLDEDIISVVASKDINVLNNSRQEQCVVQQRSKRNWSLRIKLHTSEEQDSMNGESSDEEIYSARRRTKHSTEYMYKSKGSKHLEDSNASAKGGSKKSTAQANNIAKMKLRRKDEDKIQDTSQNLKNNLSDSDHNKSDYNKKYNYDKNTRESQEDYVRISDSNAKRTSNDKLAPLFTKKRKPDPETLAARRLFLQPETTENENRNSERKVHNTCHILPFPTISHVTQLSDLNFISTNVNIPLKREVPYVPLLDTTKYKCITNFGDEEIISSHSMNKVKPQNIENVLSEIEQRCAGVRIMWENISTILKGKAEKRSPSKLKNKKKRSTERKENVSKQEPEDVQGTAWTYKYKPMSTKEIVGNEEAAGKLRDWLDGWRTTIVDRDNSSGDEFYTSDCSYSSMNENNQVAVLLGPHGCGKSASVYAVAAELGYTVLEVNASSRRTGKKLLRELEEATKSHRIRKEKDSVPPFKVVESDLKSKTLPQKSLILLEDIDLLFEEDEGFISATYQLASNTKRPIVMTSRDVCPHLSKMAPQQNRIYFQSTLGNRTAVLLELISLAETGYRLSQGCIAELLQAGDLRRAMLQLQYLLLSGSPQIFSNGHITKHSFWQDMRYSLYKPAIKRSKKRKTKKNSKSEESENTLDVLNNLAYKLDNIALMSSLTELEDAALNLSRVNVQCSLSLVEDTSLYSSSHNVSSEIMSWVSSKTFSEEQGNQRESSPSQNSFLLRKQLNTGIDLALSSVTSPLLDRKILSVDYLPSVRTICRAEDLKASINNKRGNRFFHYLHNLKVPTSSLKPSILAAACKAMQDKVN